MGLYVPSLPLPTTPPTLVATLSREMAGRSETMAECCCSL